MVINLSMEMILRSGSWKVYILDSQYRYPKKIGGNLFGTWKYYHYFLIGCRVTYIEHT